MEMSGLGRVKVEYLKVEKNMGSMIQVLFLRKAGGKTVCQSQGG